VPACACSCVPCGGTCQECLCCGGTCHECLGNGSSLSVPCGPAHRVTHHTMTANLFLCSRTNLLKNEVHKLIPSGVKISYTLCMETWAPSPDVHPCHCGDGHTMRGACIRSMKHLKHVCDSRCMVLTCHLSQPHTGPCGADFVHCSQGPEVQRLAPMHM
jgi:hypothetical protein